MATIEDLVLSVSRNTKDEISVEVSYTVHFTFTERCLNLPFSELIYLYEREKIRDDKVTIATVSEDVPDKTIAQIAHAKVMPDPANPNDREWKDREVESVKRSWKKTLSTGELANLRRVGHETPYVVVRLELQDIGTDRKLAELEIDIGDPEVPRI